MAINYLHGVSCFAGKHEYVLEFYDVFLYQNPRLLRFTIKEDIGTPVLIFRQLKADLLFY